MIKYKAKQKQLLQFYILNHKLKKSFVLTMYCKNGK